MTDETPAKTIVLLSDGTGNSSAKLFRTNVWRVYEAIDFSDGDQIAFYDNGVGTSSFKPLAILGGAFGWGLKRNVRDIYKFLCLNYRPDDRIFAFGFSRGAFTIRVLIDLINSEGVILGQRGAELNRLVAWAFRHYRLRHNVTGGLVTPLRMIRDFFLTTIERLRGAKPYDDVPRIPVRINFVGLWDTVSAYGLPVHELTRGWDQWVWPLSMDDCQLAPIVTKACHALSIDDERQTFQPLLWNEAGETDDRIVQVWFAGVHSNVGGGYPDDSLAYVPLIWIAREARKRGLNFTRSLVDQWHARVNDRGPIFDSRAGIGGYYRYGPRVLKQLTRDSDAGVRIEKPKIHHTVFRRIRSGVDGYAPIGLPRDYVVLHDNDTVTEGDGNAYELSAEAKRRTHAQQRCWNLVWLRRIVYFATVAVTLLLALIPFVKPGAMKPGATLSRFDTPVAWLSKTIVIVSGLPFVPAFLSPWLNHYQRFPLRLIAIVAVLAILLYVGGALRQAIVDRMRDIWDSRATARVPSAIDDALFAIRTSPGYRGFFKLFKRYLLPTAFGWSVLAILVGTVLVTANRAVFEGASALGLVCSESSDPIRSVQIAPDSWETWMPNNQLCAATGITLEQDHKYRATIELPQENRWFDETVPVPGPAGFSSNVAPWIFYPALPIRRSLGQSWFVPIAKIGATGREYHALAASSSDFTARKTGRLFLFVNDGVAPFCWTCLYSNNHGGLAHVIVTRLN